MAAKLTLNTEVKYLKGVGPARAEALDARAIHSVEDLLFYTPFRYEDRSRLTPIRDLMPGQTTTVLAEVIDAEGPGADRRPDADPQRHVHL